MSSNYDERDQSTTIPKEEEEEESIEGIHTGDDQFADFLDAAMRRLPEQELDTEEEDKQGDIQVEVVEQRTNVNLGQWLQHKRKQVSVQTGKRKSLLKKLNQLTLKSLTKLFKLIWEYLHFF